MNADWQTYIAAGIVIVTAAWFVLRSLRKKKRRLRLVRKLVASDQAEIVVRVRRAMMGGAAV